MKIEMGESLMLSWLKHAKECKIAQLNWKPSSNWNTYNEKEVEALYNKTILHFPVFKQNSNLEQIIKQAEIDVLGLSYENNTAYYYAVDIAYHESGLNYGSKDETIERISKKLLRSAFLLYLYFDVKDGEIIFASPKINSAVYDDLEKQIDKISKFMSAEGFQYKFKLFANTNFAENILNPIIQISSTISDTSELFMRAFQLSNLCEKSINKKQNTKKHIQNSEIRYNEFKIGTTIKTKLNYLFSKNYLSTDDISHLKNKEFCKDIFNLNFPLLIDKNQSRYDKNGYSRYWKEIFNDKYYACSQWIETQRSQFEDWYNSLVEKNSVIS